MRAMATLAVLCVGLSAAAQERPASDSSAPTTGTNRGNWLTRWLPFGRKQDPPKAPEPKKPAEAAAVVRAREEAAFLRRRDVCLKLQEIAIRTRDEELLRKVEELDQMAWHTYMQRTAHLPSSAGAFEADEQTLAQRLPPGSDTRALTEPAGRDRTGGVAQRRE
ncbi:MAG: hypothetical protein L0Z62_19940 [Gemmataceae bacterium]|nr:hypothetical protein [Gemmataceae bacterium]